MAEKIYDDFTEDHKHLEFISKTMGQFSLTNPKDVHNIFSFYEGGTVISHLEILLPGDQVLTADGDLIDASGILSFEQEASLGPHISGRSASLHGTTSQILRDFVPITNDTETVAMLYGVVSLDSLPHLYHVHAFNGQTQTYIIDCSSGDFLMDTWHNELGNVADLKSRAADGYSTAQMTRDIDQLRSGSTVFYSSGAKENFYCYYEPVGIHDWMLMLSVPESGAFSRLQKFMTSAYFLAAFMALILILYFLWVLQNIRKEKQEKEDQLRQMAYMHDIEKLLFNAHIKPENIEKALWKISERMTAEAAFLLVLDDNFKNWRYIWKSHMEKLDEQELSLVTDHIQILLEHQGSIVSYDPPAPDNSPAEITGIRKRLNLRNFAVIPVLDLNDVMIGILGTCNMEKHWDDTQLLDCVAISFAMLIRNMQIFKSMKNMGMLDSLTGLLNRSSYNAAVIASMDMSFSSLACIYIDANGLHEINNHLGHDAGDRMLEFIGEELKNSFGSNSAYRIGGDEFVVICKNQSRRTVYQKAASVQTNCARQGYDISVGIEWRDTNFDIEDIIKTAEEKMMEDKRRYYQKDKHNRKIREMNLELEQMINDKRDADAFLSVIASTFSGVYFVNLDTDRVRHIFIPEYFEEMLEKSSHRFRQAILMYARSMVHPDFLRRFEEFCSYEILEEVLESGNVPEICYKRTDDTWMKLQVFKFKRYRQGNRETLWVFEASEPPTPAKETSAID